MASKTKDELTDKDDTEITAALIPVSALRWEYRVLRPWTNETLEAQLNEAGAEGWELVARVGAYPVLKRQAADAD